MKYNNSRVTFDYAAEYGSLVHESPSKCKVVSKAYNESHCR